jgi:phosphatidylserine/phosphatidylglycerophosphate/cardiolipin synthase-like enzyme
MDRTPGQEDPAPPAQLGGGESEPGSPVRRTTSIVERLAASAVPREREQRALEAAGTPSFARGLWRIAAADASSGNRVALLRNGPATFSTMLELIESAERTVCLEGYIFRHDEVGQQFASALTDAAQLCVKV